MKRVFNLIRLITALVWLGGSIAGLILLPPAIADLRHDLDVQLEALDVNVGNVMAAMAQTQVVMRETGEMLETVSATTLDASQALTETRPLLDETSVVITEEIPEALNGVLRAMPDILNTMEDVENALTLLSTFSFVIPNPLGQDFEIGLGVQYRPEVPMAQALRNVNNSLIDLAPGLEALEDDLIVVEDNVGILSEDLLYLSGDLDEIHEELNTLTAQMTLFSTSLEESHQTLVTAQKGLPATVRTLNLVVIVGLSTLACTQLPKLYLTWEQRQIRTPRRSDTAELKAVDDD